MGASWIEEKLKEFKRKYHLDKAVKSLLIGGSIVLFFIFLVLLIEHLFWFNGPVRAILLYGSMLFIIFSIAYVVYFHLLPIIFLEKRGISDTEAAKQIGTYFPEIGDKLLNTLQLRGLDNRQKDLVLAAIEQKIQNLQPFAFPKAIDLKLNFKYLRILVLVLAAFVLTSIAFPALISSSSERIINYNREFSPEAPFQFRPEIGKQKVFRNEDFALTVNIEGTDIPENVYMRVNGRTIKLTSTETGKFQHTFRNVQKDINLQFEAAGFVSKDYSINVLDRPSLADIRIDLKYPDYTGLDDRSYDNTASIVVPEGTNIEWQLDTRYTDSSKIKIESSEILPYLSDNQSFILKHQAKESFNYTVLLSNEYGTNNEELSYNVDVIPDQSPEIEIEFFADTILYEFVILSGTASDDYGISSLNSFIKVNENVNSERIYNGGTDKHSFYYKIDLDSSMLEGNVEVWVTARDNDEVNGSKTTKSRVFKLSFPDKNSIEEAIGRKSQNTQETLRQSINKSESLNEKLDKLEERLRSKKELEWQEEKLFEEIRNQRSEIEKSLDELRKQFEDLRKSEDKFNNRSDRIKDKAQKLQELMDQVLDEETKKMYEELQKLMDEKGSLQEIQDRLRDLRPSESDMEKELERALELFKRLKLESELEKAGNDLEELGERQENLAEKTENEDSSMDEISQEQQDIQEEFDQIQEKLEDINEMNQELKNPEPLQNNPEDQQEIERQLDQIKQNLQQNDRKQGSQNQRKSGQNMKKMSEAMKQMQAGMEMEMLDANIDDLRNTLDDLIKISFKQEELIREFRAVRQVDPRFVELSQDQLKLREDAQIVEDSLQALAERVVQISSFITRELSEMNRNVDEAVRYLKDRNRSKALANQQFAMTSINNLALLLDDVLRQMQNSMAQAMGKPQQGQKGNQALPNMKQLQQQLSERIKNLKEGGLKGRELSEQLAKMAAEQEMLRNQLQKLQEQLEDQNGEAAGSLGDALDMMEENEIDLVNKRVNQRLIDRQEEIMTRLLDAENAMREQDLDDEREGESAEDYDRNIPKEFEEYLKARQKEIELLRSVPLDLNPFYKKEVNDYFRRISNPN